MMTSRLIRMSGAMLVALAVGTWPLLAADPAPDQSQVPAMTGVWKLDEAASENPSGKERPEDCRRAGRGGNDPTRVRGGGAGNADSGGSEMYGGGPGNAALGADEMARFCGTLGHFYDAPAMMGLQITETAFMQLLDPETRFGYKHDINDKSQQANTPGGPAEFKLKWDDGKLIREIDTEDSLHIVEEYELSADSGTLTVTVEAGSRMVRVPNPEIKRVYVRNQ